MPATASTYLKLKLWDRDSGALWLPYEQARIRQFENIIPNEKVSLSGYVKWITNSAFALVPTLFSNQAFVTCINCTEANPPENLFITVSGKAKFDNIRPISATSRRFKGDVIIEVYDWINDKPKMEIPKVSIDYKQFKEGFTSRVEGLEPQLRDFLAFSAISSPSFLANSGGVNTALFDSTRSGLPSKVIRELKSILPQDLDDIHRVNTPFGRFSMRYKYALITEDADKPISAQVENILNHKIQQSMPEMELSLSMFSKNSEPCSITDPVCSLSDIPTVIPEETAINKLRPGIDQFDALKFMITNHMKVPVVENIEASQTQIADNLEKLVDSYGLDPSQLTRYGFLNASYNAKPSSVLRQSLSFARANDIAVANQDLVTKVYNDFFKWNFAYVYEIWEDLLSTPLANKKKIASLSIKYREIIRIIRKYHSTGESGVAHADIIREAKTAQMDTEQLIKDCLREGLIYEPTDQVYRLLREYA